MAKRQFKLKWLVFLSIILIVLIAGLVLIGNNRFHGKAKNSSLTKVKVQAGWLLNGEFAEVCSAISRGYYADEGLEVQLIPGGPTGANFVVATNALAQDSSIDIAIDGDIVPLLRGKGTNDRTKQLQLKAFAAFWNENPYGFFVKKDSGINSISDFLNKKSDGTKVKIGLTADSVIQDAIAADLGVTVDQLNITKVGFDATPLIAGDVDILAGYWTTQAYELEKAKIDYNFISAGEIPGFNQPSIIAIASEKTLKEKPEILKKWLKATIRGAQGVISNPQLSAKETVSDKCGGPSFNQEQELWLINKSIPLIKQKQIGQINKEQIEQFSKAYFNIKQIDRNPSYDELVDTSILSKIY
jgi:NitT/TauT family transport system substrate-binding protein